MANSLLLAIALLVIIRFRREARAQLEFWESPIAASLMVDQKSDGVPADGDTDRRFAQSLVRLEHQMLLLRKDFMRNSVAQASAKETPRPAAVIQQPASLPIENAVRMAQHGATITELTERCGLSLGEARLMQKLHGKPRTTH